MVKVDFQSLIPRIFFTCVAIQVFLIVADFVFNYLDVMDELKVRRIWNIAREQSIPTWFSSIQTHLLAVTVFLVALAERHHVSKRRYSAWLAISAFFLWIGIDDFAAIHERMGIVLEEWVWEGSDITIAGIEVVNPSYAWHTLIAPVFVVCGIAITLFLWQKFRQHNLLKYLVIGFGLWVVSQGIDFLEGMEVIDDYYAAVQALWDIDDEYFVSHLMKVVEEEMEMLGTTYLWVGFLYYLANAVRGWQFQVEA